MAAGALAQVSVTRSWVTPATRAPHVAFRTFDSKAAKTKVSFHVYTPEIYDADKERRFLALLGDIDGKEPADRMPQLQIEPVLIDKALANLRSATFYAKRFHAYVLRRISWNLAPELDPGPVDGRFVTVEHILPRKPEKGRGWMDQFGTPEAVSAYCNNIFDEIGLRQVDHYSGAEDENFFRIGANTNPRQFGVEVSYAFQ